MIIDKRILGICSVASKEKFRASINSVRLHNGMMIATDGHSLIMAKLPDQDRDDLPDVDGMKYRKLEDALLNAEDLATIARTIKKDKNLKQLSHAWTVSFDEDRVKFVTTDLAVHNEIEMPRTVGEFPKYEKIVKDARKRTEISIYVNPEKLRKLLVAMMQAGVDKEEYVKIGVPANRTEPLTLKGRDYNRDEVFAMLMPMSVTEDEI